MSYQIYHKMIDNFIEKKDIKNIVKNVYNYKLSILLYKITILMFLQFDSIINFSFDGTFSRFVYFLRFFTI